jgi:hypothetical protein
MSRPNNIQSQETTIRKAAEKVAQDPEKADRSLSADDRASYRESQASVIDAKRSATMHEGLLRIS